MLQLGVSNRVTVYIAVVLDTKIVSVSIVSDSVTIHIAGDDLWCTIRRVPTRCNDQHAASAITHTVPDLSMSLKGSNRVPH